MGVLKSIRKMLLGPSLADLPEEQRLKAKAMMLGAVAGHSGSTGKIEILRDEEDNDTKDKKKD